MTDIVICGIRGRMGSAVAGLARAHEGVHIIGGIGRSMDADGAAAADRAAGSDDDAGSDGDAGSDSGAPIATMRDAAALVAGADVVIDFSNAAATRELLGHAAALKGRALVIGTTGLDEQVQRQVDELAHTAAVLTAANFSIGVNLLLDLCERVAAVLPADRFDAEIAEAHHGRKIDAPSGTALALGAAVARGRGQNLNAVRRDGRSGETGPRSVGEIGMHAIRGGSVIGEHTVMFLGERERIELRHQASDRLLFAEGALTAVLWLAGREPGRYTMRDVLNL